MRRAQNPYERLPCYDEAVMQQCKDGSYGPAQLVESATTTNFAPAASPDLLKAALPFG